LSLQTGQRLASINFTSHAAGFPMPSCHRDSMTLTPEQAYAACRITTCLCEASKRRFDETPAVLNNAVLRRTPHARLELHNSSLHLVATAVLTRAIVLHSCLEDLSCVNFRRGTPAARVNLRRHRAKHDCDPVVCALSAYLIVSRIAVACLLACHSFYHPAMSADAITEI